jgi:diaminopimelate epimerase
MTLRFSKYQGTGNDFILILEQENPEFIPNSELISYLCERRFGIGADGLIIIKKHDNLDFEVDYYNADGSQSFCGNGARCSVQFSKDKELITKSCKFWAIDGEHEASFAENGDVKLRMNPVTSIEKVNNDFVLDTGSPHYVKFCEYKRENIVELGRSIRFNERFKATGINVNTASFIDDYIYVETYERGVEDETFSCGTGVTAVALAAAELQSKTNGITPIKTKGGDLRIHWQKKADGTFDDIYLEGPAKKVYDGQITL